jgi:hypothetical protein
MKVFLSLIVTCLICVQAQADCVSSCESIFDSTQGTPEERTNQYLKCTNSCPIGDEVDGGMAISSLPGQTDAPPIEDSGSASTKSSPKGSGSSTRDSKSGSSSSSNSSKSKGSSGSKSSSADKKTSEGTETKESSNHDNSTEEIACSENFDAPVSNCESATLKAKSSCDENGSLSDSMANLAASMTQLGSQYSAASIQQSCSNVANYMNSAAVALGAYRQLCGSAIATCVASCSVTIKQKCSNSSSDSLAEQAKSAMNGNKSTCNSYSGKIAQANATIQSYSTTRLNAQSCASLTSSDGLTNYCLKNPTAEGCKQPDCNSPSMASNKVCIYTKNPADPACAGTASTQSSNSASFASTENRLKKNSNAADTGDLPTSGNSDRLSSGTSQSSSNSSASAIDGRQGGSASLTPGELNPSPQKRLKVKASLDVPVLAGTYGGGGSSGSSRYAALKVEDNPDSRSARGNTQSQSPKKESPDLRQFLPGMGGLQRGRGIAGSSEVVGADGITGPHSDIWQKVRNRYTSLRETLQP